jgi:hypothetical protein
MRAGTGSKGNCGIWSSGVIELDPAEPLDPALADCEDLALSLTSSEPVQASATAQLLNATVAHDRNVTRIE